MYTLRPRFQFYDEVLLELEQETYMDEEDGLTRLYDLEGARLAQLDEDMKYELIEATWKAGIVDVEGGYDTVAEGYPIPEIYLNRVKNLLQVEHLEIAEGQTEAPSLPEESK